MYVRPSHVPKVSGAIRMMKEWRPLDFEGLDAALLDEVNLFAAQREIRGSRLEPVELGRKLLEQHAEAQVIRITVESFELDPETAYVRLHTDAFEYER